MYPRKDLILQKKEEKLMGKAGNVLNISPADGILIGSNVQADD